MARLPLLASLALVAQALGACSATVVMQTPPLDDAAVPMDAARDLAPLLCTPACASPRAYCNATHQCVACLDDSHCPAGYTCQINGGTCARGCDSDDRCHPDGGVTATACCGRTCTDTNGSINNCGGCGIVCQSAHATAACRTGKCGLGVCDPGWSDCNADPTDGCEAAIHTDPANCVVCGRTCTFPGGVAGCADGCYLAGCQASFGDCDGVDQDGCEVALDSDPHNCGACGASCPNPAHARGACVASACTLTCDMSWGDCNGNPADGCELSLKSDANNCGACGNACGNKLVCVNGGCTCPQCNLPNASAKCVNNQCLFDKCNPGYADCNNNQNDGCEAFLNGDVKNCGACGTVCPQGKSCSNGACVTTQCPPQAFFTGALPASLPASNGNAFGAFTFDGLGNLLAVSGFNNNSLYSVNLYTDKVTTLTALRANLTWVSVTYSPVDNIAYVGSSGGDIDGYNLQTGKLVQYTNIGQQSLNALAIAPMSFGNFGGQVVAGNYNGTVVAYDPIKNVTTMVANGLGLISAMVFQSTGILFTSDYNGNRINKVTAAGNTSLFANLPNSSDGMTIDEGRGRLYVADSGAQKIHWVDLGNAAVNDFVGAYGFDGGYWPTPIAFDCSGTLLVALNPGGPSKVSAVAVP